MDTEKRFLVGETVEIMYVNGGHPGWLGFPAEVLPWPEDEEQFVDGLLHNWLKPSQPRPDGYGYKEFMWPTRSLRKP